MDINIPHVFMPNLQVLYHRTFGPLQFPLSYVTMPSLRYLAIHFWIHSNEVTLNDILLAYGQNLQSVIIQMHSSCAIEAVQFPPWNKLPRLEDLVLSRQWSIQFEPIPAMHPLRKLVARHAKFDALLPFFDAANMKQLLLLGASWLGRGELLLEEGASITEPYIVSELEEKARTRGIRFAVSQKDENEDKFVTR
jgi:hypothetical protein